MRRAWLVATVVVIAVAVLLAFQAGDTVRAPVMVEARVVSVTDGDSLVVQVGGREERLRLIGIDAPEFDECFGSEATDALAGLVAGGRVWLEADVSDRDRFGRILRYVYLNDTLVNERLVEEGHAIARRYPPDTIHAPLLGAAERRARTDERGLWSACPSPLP